MKVSRNTVVIIYLVRDLR